MACINSEKVFARLRANRIPNSECFTTVPDLIKLIEEIFSSELDIPEGNNFVYSGFNVPSNEDKGKLWIRTAKNGQFLGFYYFVNGCWQRVYNYRNDEIIWMFGDSRDLPAGFELIDGSLGGIPTNVQNHLMQFYQTDSSVSSTSPVYSYFAVRYSGIF